MLNEHNLSCEDVLANSMPISSVDYSILHKFSHSVRQKILIQFPNGCRKKKLLFEFFADFELVNVGEQIYEEFVE